VAKLKNIIEAIKTNKSLKEVKESKMMKGGSKAGMSSKKAPMKGGSKAAMSSKKAPTAPKKQMSSGRALGKEFKTKFADARKSGQKTFTFKGKKYTTKLA